MIYLVRLKVDYQTAAIKKLSDLYRWHQFLWKLFPDMPNADRKFLTRIDSIEDGFGVYVLSSSAQPVKPDWCKDGNNNFEMKQIPSSFLNHNLYRFDLVANPTKKVKSFDESGKPKKNGKRIALLDELDQIEWLKRKGEQNGFRLSDSASIQVDPAIRNHFHLKSKNDDRKGTHIGVRYRGVLEVINRELFREGFYKGIGSAKGFGFGLLLLQPIQ